MLLLILLAILNDIFIFRNCDNTDIRDQYGREEERRGEKERKERKAEPKKEREKHKTMTPAKPGLLARNISDGRITTIQITAGHELQLNAINPVNGDIESANLMVGTAEESQFITLYSPFGTFSGPLCIVGPTSIKFKAKGGDFHLVGR